MRRFIAALLCLSLFLLAGCVRQDDSRRLAVVEMIGVDRVEGGYRVSAQIFDPLSGEDAKAKNYNVAAAEGATIAQAVEELGLKTGGKIFWGGNNLIAIGTEAAREGIFDIVNYFNSVGKIRPLTPVILVEGKAAYLIGDGAPGVPASSADLLFTQAKVSASAVDSTVMSVMTPLLNQGESPSIACYRCVEGPEGDGEMLLTGTAVFDRDKLAGLLDREASRGLLWCMGKVKQAVVSMDDAGLGRISLEASQKGRSIKVELEDGKPVFTIRVAVKASVIDASSPFGSGVSLDDTKKIEKCLKELVEREVSLAISQTALNQGEDLLGFGRYLRKKEPEFWKSYGETGRFNPKDAAFRVLADVEVERMGTQAKASRPG